MHRVRRPLRADRPAAPRDGRGAAMDRRGGVCPGAEVLHAPAGTRGPAVGHMDRMASARHPWRPCIRSALFPARRAPALGIESGLCAGASPAGHPGIPRWRQAGGRGAGIFRAVENRPQDDFVRCAGRRRRGGVCFVSARWLSDSACWVLSFSKGSRRGTTWFRPAAAPCVPC